jgi:hypothetical protein
MTGMVDHELAKPAPTVDWVGCGNAIARRGGFNQTYMHPTRRVKSKPALPNNWGDRVTVEPGWAGFVDQ